MKCSDQHIDVVLYYLRKKHKYHGESHDYLRFTTTDNMFDGTIRATWEQVLAKKKQGVEQFDYDWASLANISAYMIGQRILCNWPWTDVDAILMPVNVQRSHWVLAVFRLKEWKIEDYDSMAKPRRHNNVVIEALQGMATIIPNVVLILCPDGNFHL